jgi:hypothetical protein
MPPTAGAAGHFIEQRAKQLAVTSLGALEDVARPCRKGGIGLAGSQVALDGFGDGVRHDHAPHFTRCALALESRNHDRGLFATS